jgi:DNA-binding response OmpR family regulator
MDQAKLRFFTNISHDFKTPLSLIIGPLEKITEQIKGSENQKYFSIIQNNIGRLQRLIDQLIAYRKAETGHLELSYSKSTIGNFMYPLMETFEDYTQRAGVNFYYKVNSPNKHIVLDVNKTERILLNLFSNAVKYDDLNREVNIESGIRSDDDKEIFYIEVSNTGKGITEDKMDKLFDRFYSGAQDMGNGGGSGIGLAMCKSLIELMEGTILVSSAPGQKTAFKIELPLDKSLYVEEILNLEKHRKIVTDWLPIEIVGDQERSSDGLRPNLLIIDDEKDVRNFLQEAFKNNYNITLAANGEDGLHKLKEKPPQLVISDVMMPKLNGYELCEQIKSNLEYCNIPVVLLTALDDDTKKTEGFELGADAYITKPFSIKQLEVRVKKLIENKQRIFEYFSVNSVLPETNEPIKISKRDQDFLEKITVSIEKNMESSTFGVEELAVEVGMSTSNFYRRLKQLTGQAPNSYLRNFRFQKAAELLKDNPDLTATEVMYDIGIESTSYYSTSFKKLHGYSPSEFVKRIKG